LGQLVVDPAPEVATVDAAGGAILVDERERVIYPLTASGALVWSCFDGASSLEEICRDIAGELAVPYERVADDALVLVAELLERRLATAPGSNWNPPRPRASTCGCSAHDGGADLVASDGWLAEPGYDCRDRQFPLGAAGQVTARLVDTCGSEHLVGVRTNDADAANELRDRLGSRLADAPFRFPNLEVRFGSRRGRVRDRHVVLRRGVVVLATSSRQQAIEGVLAQLPTFLPVPDGLTPFRTRALERDRAAVLVHEDFGVDVDAHHRTLTTAGWTALPATPVLVDANRAEVLLPRGDDPCAPSFEPVPISQVIVPAAGSPDLAPPQALAALELLIAGPNHPIRAANVRALVALAAAVPIVRVDTRLRHEAVRILDKL
jgi:hypothetical protein